MLDYFINITLNGSCDGVGLSVRIEYDDADDPTYPITYVIDSEDGLVIGHEDGGRQMTCKEASDAIRGLIESGGIGDRSPVTLKLLGEDCYVPNWGGIEDNGDGTLVLPVPDGWEPDGRSYGVPFNYANDDISVLEEDILYATYKFITVPFISLYPERELVTSDGHMLMPGGWECGDTLDPNDVAKQCRIGRVPDDEEIVMLDVTGVLTICHSGVYMASSSLIALKFGGTKYFPWGSHPKITDLGLGRIRIDDFTLSGGYIGMHVAPMLQYLFDGCD